MSAASAAEKTPASTTRTPASDERRSGRRVGSLTGSSGRSPGGEQLVLEAEHLLVLLGLGVVVAEQVQDAVHGQQLDLGLGAVAGGRALLLGDRRAQHQVAEHALLGLLVDQAGTQLVHREGEHVGRALLLHPLLVELGDGRLVDGLDAQLGERVDAHPVHHEPAQRGEPGDVELVARTR